VYEEFQMGEDTMFEVKWLISFKKKTVSTGSVKKFTASVLKEIVELHEKTGLSQIT